TNGLLHIFEATNKSQRHVTDIQHRDLVDIFQSCSDRQDEPNQNTYLRKRKEVDYNEDRMSKRVYHDGDITPSPCSLTDNSLFETPQHLSSASNKSNNNESDDFTSGEEVEEVIDDWINYYFDNLETSINDNSKHSYLAKQIFYGLADDVPIVALRKTSKDEHSQKRPDFVRLIKTTMASSQLQQNTDLQSTIKSLQEIMS
ncbi:1982_t:CDS:2, partial [Funneliformis mosseae]